MCSYSSSATIFFLRAGFVITEPGLLCAIRFFCFLSSASVMVRRSLVACADQTQVIADKALPEHCTLLTRQTPALQQPGQQEQPPAAREALQSRRASVLVVGASAWPGSCHAGPCNAMSQGRS